MHRDHEQEYTRVHPAPWRRVAGSAVWRAAAITVSVGSILPLVWTVTLSLRTPGKPLPVRLEWLPNPPAWSNYPEVFRVIEFGLFAINSVIVAAIAVPITIIVASWGGFALAHLSRRWRQRITVLAIGAMMIPLTALWLPRFILVKEAGLIDTRAALVFPAIFGTSPFFVLLFLWTFLRVPASIFEAAQLDGAGAFRVWAGIALPLARPTVVAVGVLAFVRYWSNFVEPLLYIQSTAKMTLPLGLQALLQLDRTNWPLLMAASVMVTAPVITVFALVQRAFFPLSADSR